MFRILFILLLYMGVLSAAEKVPMPNEVPSHQASVCPISCLLTGETASPPTGMHIIRPHEPPPQTWMYAASTLPGDVLVPRVVQRTGTGQFIAGMIALAVPVQTFIKAYSSVDSGTNSYSYPAIHIRPQLRRGYAGVYVQVRF